MCPIHLYLSDSEHLLADDAGEVGVVRSAGHPMFPSLSHPLQQILGHVVHLSVDPWSQNIAALMLHLSGDSSRRWYWWQPSGRLVCRCWLSREAGWAMLVVLKLVLHFVQCLGMMYPTRSPRRSTSPPLQPKHTSIRPSSSGVWWDVWSTRSSSRTTEARNRCRESTCIRKGQWRCWRLLAVILDSTVIHMVSVLCVSLSSTTTSSVGSW